jgi:hypothetical protein
MLVWFTFRGKPGFKAYYLPVLLRLTPSGVLVARPFHRLKGRFFLTMDEVHGCTSVAGGRDAGSDGA